MKKRVALVRGPNLNSWEMQNFIPLASSFDLVGFTSTGFNFDADSLPIPVHKLFSVQQFSRARLFRNTLARIMGGYHDLWGLENSLRGFDIVHCVDTTYYCSYQAARAKKNSNFRLILTIWENIPYNYNFPSFVRNKNFVIDTTDMFLCVSKKAREVLILEGADPGRINVLMPGIDIEHFKPAPKDKNLLRTYGCEEDDIVILFVGNLTREKGIYDLLFAFRHILDGVREPGKVKLLLAGKGRERETILRFIQQLRMTKAVTLIGSHPYHAMPSIHNLADLFVLPSIPTLTWQEQFGYVLAESMACEKPVVSTMSGAIPEVIDNAGILVPPNDFVSLASSITSLIESAAKRRELGKLGRKRAELLFDSRKVAKKLQQHYESVIGND